MSTKKERAALTQMALKEWGVVTQMLAERGETWPHNVDVLRWGPGLGKAMERAKALADACAIIGADEACDLGSLCDLYERTRNTT